MTFASERILVDEFVNLLEAQRTPWGEVRVTREFDYSRGRTDVVAVTGTDTLIAIEAKLNNWKLALHQAYRNTCFAHRSFVLLPKQCALSAHGHVGEFERRGVGLCYIDRAEVVVLHESAMGTPIEPWLAFEAISQVKQSS